MCDIHTDDAAFESCIVSDWLLINQSETEHHLIGLRHFFGFNFGRWKNLYREEQHQIVLL